MGLDEILFSSNEDWKEEEEDDENSGQTSASYACEDCDYRWDSLTSDNSGANDMGYDEEEDIICPMCGSTYITQI